MTIMRQGNKFGTVTIGRYTMSTPDVSSTQDSNNTRDESGIGALQYSIWIARQHLSEQWFAIKIGIGALQHAIRNARQHLSEQKVCNLCSSSS